MRFATHTFRASRGRMLCTFIALGFSFLFSTQASAQPNIGLELRLRASAGGDSLATVEYEDGTESDLQMGTYVAPTLGVLVTPLARGPHALDLTGSVAWGTWSTGPENTEDRLILTRFPLELLAAYRYVFGEGYALRGGGGLTYHLGTGISGSGALEGFEVDVDDGLGFVGELGFVFADIVELSLRYTKLSHDIDGETFDASSFGVSLAVVFPLEGPALGALPE